MIKICKQCKQEFETIIKTQKYCCRKCSMKRFKRKNKTCIYCGKEFKPQNTTQKYCSRNCYANFCYMYKDKARFMLGKLIYKITKTNLKYNTRLKREEIKNILEINGDTIIKLINFYLDVREKEEYTKTKTL